MKFNFSSHLIRQYAIVLVVNLAVVTTGMSLNWSSPVLVKLRNATETPLPEPIGEEEGSWVVSAGYLCGTFTCVLGGMLLDLVGRKYSVLLAMVPRLIMAIWLIFANRVWMFIFCRAVMTVTDILVFTVVPVYASEIASKEHRGSLGVFLQIFSSVGIVITLSVGPFVSYTVFSIFITGAIVISTIPLIFLPDSPFYLYSKGRTEEAVKVLTQIRGSEELANKEIEEYDLSKNNEETVDKLTLLKNRVFIKSVLLGCLVTAGTQLVGFNAVQFYLQTILESARTNLRPEISSVIIGAIQVLASFLTMLSSRLFKRKTILLVSLSGMCLGMLGLGTFFTITDREGYEITGFMNYLPIISLILVIFCFCAGIGSLLWVIVAEIFEGPGRALGFSISMTSSTFVSFLTTKYFAQMTSAVGPAATYWFFSGMSVLVGTLIAIFLPETKGKTFNEIQELLGGQKSHVQDISVVKESKTDDFKSGV